MKRLYFAIAVVIAAIIFIFSSQTSTESEYLSYRITDTMYSTIYSPQAPSDSTPPSSDAADDATDTETFEDESAEFHILHTLVRKGAHFFLFVCLGLSAGMWAGFLKNAKKYKLTFCACALYGALDETKQLFIDGRAFMVTDILIDSAGALVGIILAFLIYRRVYGNAANKS